MTHDSVFLAAVLPPQGPYIAASIADGKTWQQSVGTIPELIALNKRWLAKGRDCYFLVASVSDGALKTGLRKGSNIAGLRSLRIDLDAGAGKTYATRQDIEAALMVAVNKKYLPMPWVVNSGGGYHCYWPLIETLNPMTWEVVAKRFLSYVRDTCGIAVDDPACTTDTARILRMPSTVNLKQLNAPREVKVVMEGAPALQSSLWTNVMDRAGTAMVAAGKTRRVSEVSQVRSQLQRDLEEATQQAIDPNLVFEQCAQLRYVRANTDSISEPLWYAALGAAVFVSDEMVLAVSEGHPDYSPNEALRKAQQWKSAATGPTTCSKFYSLNAPLCAGCTYATSITSPVQLGRGLRRVISIAEAASPVVVTPDDTALPSEQTLTPEETRVKTAKLVLQRGIDAALSVKISIDSAGVFIIKKDAEGVPARIRIYGPGPIVILAAQEIEGSYNLAIAYEIDMVTSAHKIKILRSGTLAGNGAAKEWMDSFMMNAHPLAAEFLASWCQAVAKNPACELVGRHGFTDETNTRFVVGDTVYTSKGESAAMLRGGLSAGGRLPSYRTGSIAPWIKAASAYAAVGAEPFACTVLAAFASPLVKYVHEHTPAALFIEGATGGGKTTAVRVAAAVWGHYEDLEQGGSSTVAGLRLIAARMNALPIFVDETRSSDVRMARNFLYDMSNGSSRTTGSPGQMTIQRDPFTLITVVTSNTPAGTYFFDADAPTNRNTTAGISARVLPLKVNAHTARASDEHMPYLSNNSLAKNYGLAGAQYIRYVLSNEAYVNKTFRELHHYVKMALAAVGVSGAGERAAVTIAALCTAGAVTNRLGLTTYDMDHLRGYLINSFGAWILERNNEHTAATDVAERFFEQHHRTASVILSNGLMSGTAMLAPMVVSKGRAYFMAGILERSSGTTGLTRTEIREQMEQQKFTRMRPPFAPTIDYYQGPLGLYVAQVETIKHT